MNKYTLLGISLIVLVAMLALASTPAPALAQGATPTPTLIWETPTPWPTADPTAAAALGFNAEIAAEDVSNTVINGYRFVNQTGVVDILVFVSMGALIVMLLIRVVRRATEIKDS